MENKTKDKKNVSVKIDNRANVEGVRHWDFLHGCWSYTVPKKPVAWNHSYSS